MRAHDIDEQQPQTSQWKRTVPTGALGLRQRLLQRLNSSEQQHGRLSSGSSLNSGPSGNVRTWRSASRPPIRARAVDSLPEKMEEVMQIQSSLLSDVVKHARTKSEGSCMEGKVNLNKFFEFYKGYREQSLRGRMEKLKEQLEHEEASSSSGQLADACFAQVETQLGKNVDHMVYKLKEMVIDEPAAGLVKKPRSKIACQARVRTVPALASLCISKCAQFVEYLPALGNCGFPDDLLQRLISHLIDKQLLDNVSLVKLLSPSMRSLNLAQCYSLDSDSFAAIGATCPSLRSLDLSGLINLSFDAVAQIIESMGTLEEINCSSCYELNDQSVCSIAAGAQQLTCVDLSSCPKITDAAVEAVLHFCPRLERLILRNCSQITDAPFRMLANCPSLSQLDLVQCASITDQTLENLTACSSLKTLRVSGTGVSDTGLSSLLDSVGSLSELELVGCNVTNSSIHRLADSCPHLEKLNLSHCRNITDGAFAFDLGAPKFYNLKQLDLTRCLNISDQTLRSISAYCQPIEALVLDSCEDVTDQGINAVAERCPKLTYVNLSKCRNVTEASLTKLARLAPNMRTLKLENCAGVNGMVLEEIATNCPNLEEIDLSSCEGISGDNIKTLVSYCTNLECVTLQDLEMDEAGLLALSLNPKIKHLNLAYCQALTDRSLLSLATSCPSVTWLDLSGCTNISLPGLQLALDQWQDLQELHLRGFSALTSKGFSSPRLHTLNLSWCKKLQDIALCEIATGCPSLVNIDLAWCVNITGSTVHRLAQRSAFLKTLNLRGCSKIPNLTAQFLLKAGKTVKR